MVEKNTCRAVRREENTLIFEGDSTMRNKAKLMCCVVAVLGLVATGGQAALFEDDFSGDLSKWDVVSAQNANDKVEITVDNELRMYAQSSDTASVTNSLTTKTLFSELHTLELDIKRPSTEDGAYGFTLQYGLDPWGAEDISYYAEWCGNGSNQLNIYSCYNSAWGYRCSVASPTLLSQDKWYHMVVENAATSTTISIYDGTTLVDSETFNHDPIGTDRVIKLKNAASAGPNTMGMYVDNVVVTPEPTTMVLLGLGGIGLLIRRRRRA